MKNERIVCLVPSLTELLVDLGLGSQIVGATNYCVHPNDLDTTRVSGTKNPNLSSIIGLKPSYLLCNREENRREDVEQLQKALPNCRVRITDIGSFEDSLSSITVIAEDLKVTAPAHELVTKLRQLMRDMADLGKNCRHEPLKVLYLIWKKPWMTVGSDTYIHNILQSFGLIPCITDLRYPVLSEEELLGIDWDVLLLSSEPYPFKAKDCEELSKKTQRPVILVNGEHYSWYGTRLLKAAPNLKSELIKIFNT